MKELLPIMTQKRFALSPENEFLNLVLRGFSMDSALSIDESG
jgi:hypothetical protein